MAISRDVCAFECKNLCLYNLRLLGGNGSYLVPYSIRRNLATRNQIIVVGVMELVKRIGKEEKSRVVNS